jgi:hypothetical protein
MPDINRLSNANLTLFNESGETYPAGEITTLIHTNKGLTLRWSAVNPFTHVLPLTHAAIYTGKRILQVVAIRPLDNGVTGTELELRV